MSLKELRIVGIKPLILFVSGSCIIALLPAIFIVIMRVYLPDIAMKFVDGGMERINSSCRKLDWR